MPMVIPAILYGAGLISIGTAVVLKAVITIVAGAAFGMHQRKKAKNALKRLGDVSADAGTRTMTAKEPAGPRRVIYGECRAGGNIVFIHTSGSNNEYIHFIIAVASHEVTSFSAIQFDDEGVNLDSSGNATGRFAGYARVLWAYGTPTQSANATLISECGDVWTSDHQGKGIAYLYVRLKYNSSLFPNGLPTVTALVKGKKVYDPRSALTVWSNNAALCLADYLTDTKVGMGFDYFSEIDEAELIASANNCDEQVVLDAGGTENRYTINGIITADTVHQDVVDDFTEAMAGTCTYVSGKWVIMSGYYRTPTLSFNENDVASGMSIQTKISRQSNFNAVKGTYISPINYWRASDYPPITNSTYQTQDTGERIFRDIAFPFTTSAATCQRLAKIALEKIRQPITVSFTGKISFLQAQCGDVILLSNTRMGWSNKPFEVTHCEITASEDKGIGVDVVLRETASTVYTWADGEDVTVDSAPNTNLLSPFFIAPPTGITVLSDNTTTEEQPDSTYIARMKVSWTAPADAYVTTGGYIRLQYKRYDGPIWLDWGLLPGSQTEDYIFPVITDGIYVARIRSENNNFGTYSDWVYSDPTTATGDTTAPAVPTSFTVSGAVNGIYLDWVNATDADFNLTEIYEHTATTPAPTGSSTPYASVSGPASAYFRSGLSAGTTRYYWIRSVDTSGNHSAWVGPSGGTSAPPLSGATAEPTYLYASTTMGDGQTLCESDLATANVSGGSTPYSYSWTKVSGASEIFVNASSTGQTVSFLATRGTPWAVSYSAVYKCVITDAGSQTIDTNTVTVEMNFEDQF